MTKLWWLIVYLNCGRRRRVNIRKGTTEIKPQTHRQEGRRRCHGQCCHQDRSHCQLCRSWRCCQDRSNHRLWGDWWDLRGQSRSDPCQSGSEDPWPSVCRWIGLGPFIRHPASHPGWRGPSFGGGSVMVHDRVALPLPSLLQELSQHTCTAMTMSHTGSAWVISAAT